MVITPDDTELEDLFADLAQNISKPGATDIVIRDTVSPCFQILSVSNPTKGTASILDATTLQWNIDKLGVTASEGASLTFTVQHVGPCTGTVEVNADISYSDNSGNIVTFPSPTIDVVCDNVVQIEPCPTPVSVTVGGCEVPTSPSAALSSYCQKAWMQAEQPMESATREGSVQDLLQTMWIMIMNAVAP